MFVDKDCSIKGQPTNGMQHMDITGCNTWGADDDVAGLCREFPDFDRGLVEGMLADQGGDVPEVHACLRVRLPLPSCASSLHHCILSGASTGLSTQSCASSLHLCLLLAGTTRHVLMWLAKAGTPVSTLCSRSALSDYQILASQHKIWLQWLLNRMTSA